MSALIKSGLENQAMGCMSETTGMLAYGVRSRYSGINIAHVRCANDDIAAMEENVQILCSCNAEEVRVKWSGANNFEMVPQIYTYEKHLQKVLMVISSHC